MSRSQATILIQHVSHWRWPWKHCHANPRSKALLLVGSSPTGGHIEAHEGLVESVIREVKEETGLTIKNPKLVGMKHFYTTDNERYLVFLYRTSDFEEKSIQQRRAKFAGLPGRMCLRWTWLMTCSICYVSLKKTISQNFSIGSDSKWLYPRIW